jgi:hypothetical protein
VVYRPYNSRVFEHRCYTGKQYRKHSLRGKLNARSQRLAQFQHSA